jgi:hypothetical protein
MNGDMKKNYVVYRMKNKVNGRVYFGSTANFSERKRAHIRAIEKKNLSLGGQYVRDAIIYDHQPSDFVFSILDRFSNKEEMLRHEQKLLNMYWSTRNCYNLWHEVVEGFSPPLLFVWDMRTLEVRNYLSCHAIRKDLGFSKKDINDVLVGKKDCVNGWVIEYWEMKRTKDEVSEMYKRNTIAEPVFASIELSKDNLLGVTNHWPIDKILGRDLDKYQIWGQPEGGKKIRLIPNWEYEYLWEKKEGALRFERERKILISRALRHLGGHVDDLRKIGTELEFLLESVLMKAQCGRSMEDSYKEYVSKWGAPARVATYVSSGAI